MEIEPTRSRPSGKPARLLPWRRILVPVDFSKASLEAPEVAVPLACDHGARLFLLSVVVPAMYATGVNDVALAAPDNALVEEIKARVPEIVRRFVPPAAKVTPLISLGRAVNVTTQVTKEKDVDLIALTTHGRTGIDHVLMGNMAKGIVRQAHCPVYVLPSLGRIRGKRKRGD
jgi:nucleotide-binding universal stress UspA family protein